MSLINRELTREQLNADVEAFLAKGGEITVDKTDPMPKKKTKKYVTMKEREENRRKRAMAKSKPKAKVEKAKTETAKKSPRVTSKQISKAILEKTLFPNVHVLVDNGVCRFYTDDVTGGDTFNFFISQHPDVFEVRVGRLKDLTVDGWVEAFKKIVKASEAPKVEKSVFNKPLKEKVEFVKKLYRDGVLGTPKQPNRGSSDKDIFWRVYQGHHLASSHKGRVCYPYALAAEQIKNEEK